MFCSCKFHLLIFHWMNDEVYDFIGYFLYLQAFCYLSLRNFYYYSYSLRVFFFPQASADGLSLEFEWQQVSSSLLDSFQYSGQCWLSRWSLHVLWFLHLLTKSFEIVPSALITICITIIISIIIIILLVYGGARGVMVIVVENEHWTRLIALIPLGKVWI